MSTTAAAGKAQRGSSLAQGLALCLGLAVVAWFLGKGVPVVGGAVFGIVLGLVVGAVRRPGEALRPGIRFTSRNVLQYAIILLGFEMQIGNVIRVGADSLSVMLFTLAAAFLTAYLAGKQLHLHRNTAVLIGMGTAICGGSAIAAAAPIVQADDEEVAQAISTIFAFNVVAVFLFPALGRLMHLTDTGFGVWAGTAVNDTSSVVATASAWSQAAGSNTALALATIVKLTRTLMIIPVALALSVFMMRQHAHAGKASGQGFSFVRIFPWFVLGFVATTLVNSFVPLPAGAAHDAVIAGKFLIVAAMVAIGLGTSIRRLLASGVRPILLGLLCWIAVAVVSLVVQRLTGRI